MSDSFDEIERVFLALSDKTRIKLVNLMYAGEVSVNDLSEALGISQPKVSRHLAYLRSMEIVNTRRDGKWIYYSLCEPENEFGSRLLSDAIDWIASIMQGETSPEKTGSQNVGKKRGPAFEQNNIYGKADVSNESKELEVYLL